MHIGIQRSTHYKVECFGKAVRGRDARGRFTWTRTLKWVEEFDNLVVTAGLNDSLDKHFKAAVYTAAWYVGLTGATPVFDPTDTMGAHAGWTEDTNYAEAVRQTLTLGAIAGGSVSNSGSKATFSINANGTLGGAFVTTSNVKGGAAGTLYGGGAFATGNRAVINGDTVQVTVILTAAAA